MNRVLCIALLAITSFISGCAAFEHGNWPGEDAAKYFQRIVVTEPDGKVTEKMVASEGARKLPKDVKKYGIFSVGEEGTTSGGGMTWEIKLDALVENASLFYITGISLLVGGIVLAVWAKQFVLGASVAGAGVVCLVAPTVIPMIGMPIAILFILLLTGGVVWVAAKWFKSSEIKAKAIEDSAKLMSEGKKREAIAVRRAGDEQFNKDYQEAKENGAPTLDSDVSSSSSGD